jgi:hypothetical protein
MTPTEQEAELIESAQPVLGDEPIVAAGVFGLQHLVSGASASDADWFTDPEDDASVGSPADVELIVAVTTERILVIRWGHDPGPERIVGTFARATTEVEIARFGLSRMIKLEDPASGAHIELHASVSPAARRGGPDQHVLEELVRTAA